MCFSAESSFATAGLLLAGGAYSLYKARHMAPSFFPLASFPILVGIQQAIEGFVWTGFSLNDQNMISSASILYLFFVWIVWPTWIPFMTAGIEPSFQKRKAFHAIAAAGLALGLLLYLPSFWHTDWLETEIKNHSIAYHCTFITEPALPKSFVYMTYLALVTIAPLTSSWPYMRIWGMGLLLFVPVTYAFYNYAEISILCFFAALMTLYIVYIIAVNKLIPVSEHAQEKTKSACAYKK